MTERIHIEQKNEYEYQVHNLPRNEGVWLQVENFDVQIKRTDEGIIVCIYDFDDESREDYLESAYTFDSETKAFAEDDDE